MIMSVPDALPPEWDVPTDPNFENYLLAKCLFKDLAHSLGYSMIGLIKNPRIQAYLQNHLRLEPIHGSVRSCQLSIYDWKNLLFFCLKFFLRIPYRGEELEARVSQLWIAIDELNAAFLQPLFFKVFQVLRWKFLLFLIYLNYNGEELEARTAQFWQSIDTLKDEALEPFFGNIFGRSFENF